MPIPMATVLIVVAAVLTPLAAAEKISTPVDATRPAGHDLSIITAEAAPPRTTAAEIVAALIADASLREEVERELAARQQPLDLLHPAENSHRRLAGAWHTIFKLTCIPGEGPGSHCMFVSWRMYGLWLFTLALLTVVIEAIIHNIEHLCGDAHDALKSRIFHKMIREYALLHGTPPPGLCIFARVVVVGPHTLRARVLLRSHQAARSRRPRVLRQVQARAAGPRLFLRDHLWQRRRHR